MALKKSMLGAARVMDVGSYALKPAATSLARNPLTFQHVNKNRISVIQEVDRI